MDNRALLVTAIVCLIAVCLPVIRSSSWAWRIHEGGPWERPYAAVHGISIGLAVSFLVIGLGQNSFITVVAGFIIWFLASVIITVALCHARKLSVEQVMGIYWKVGVVVFAVIATAALFNMSEYTSLPPFLRWK